MEYTVNGSTLSYEPVGECRWGPDEVLLDQGVDLTASKPWHTTGYTIETLFEGTAAADFQEKTQGLLRECWRDAGLSLDDNFKLDQYHTLIRDFQMHRNVLEKTKLLSVERFPVAIRFIEDRVSQICKVPLVAKNPFDQQSVFHFRVVRPQQSDNNPLHRDIWLEDYDNCINLYIPVAGSNELSSLIIIPESHRWPESRIERTVSGAEIKGVKFNVPAVTAIQGHYVIERPNPQDHQVLVFSPYLIHGGSVNLNPDQTRISIEMRLWKR